MSFTPPLRPGLAWLALLLCSSLTVLRGAAPSPEGVAARAAWVDWVERVAAPVLDSGARGQLLREIPLPQRENRRAFAPLEATARVLCGLAPWLESDAAVPAREAALRERFRREARLAIAALVDPASPSRVDFTAAPQVVVDTAFLAQAFLRAPRQLWEPLPAATKVQVVAAFQTARGNEVYFNNWLLFAAVTEAFLNRAGATADAMRIDYALRQHEQWYVGDGFYRDGPEFHFDYYNSIVIQPMLVDLIGTVAASPLARRYPGWSERLLERAQRHAAVLERQISPEGTLPVTGRSLAYRCGVLHGLAQIALLERLPPDVRAAAVRGALTAVITRHLGAPGTFDDRGWLRAGFAGDQPDIAETYITTASLYLCTAAFLPLGLPPENPFWADAPADWTARRAYAGENLPADHALKPKPTLLLRP
jgi:hypothetical protein